MNDFKSISNFRFEYVLENDISFSITLRQRNFPHLIGLHKLTDIPIIKEFNNPKNPKISARYLNMMIRKEELLTDEIIRKSEFFHLIERRYNHFSKNNILSVTYTDVIVDFDPKKINSLLKANYILFEEKDGNYSHLCVSNHNSKYMYAESFFYTDSDYYVRNQHVLKIKEFRIYDNDGMKIHEDLL